ncbi:MAG: hypothetical protein RIN55_03050 [Tissierellaceae bacterium]|nr:hypothetical protein [Tissierellaceae bacterium]
MNNKASKIKIVVIDPESDLNLHLPAVRFGFLSFMASSALLFKPFMLRNNELNDNAFNVINKFDKEMIKEIIRELKSIGPLDLVDISTGNGTQIKISTL